MIFKKYQFLIFKYKHGLCSSATIPGWFILLVVFLLLGVIISNIYLWNFYRENHTVSDLLQRSEETVNTQKTQLISMYHKLTGLEQDLERVRELDGKLRIMLNLDPPKQTAQKNPAGGTQETSFMKFAYHQELFARKMHDFIDQLKVDARMEEVRQQEILIALRKQREILASTPSIWPAQGLVTSEFGYRTSPFTGQREFHQGIDISAPEGTPIYAPANGRVTYTGKDGGYGITLVIDHGRGIKTRYAHLQRHLVYKKDEIFRGQLIGYVGNTGRSTGPHLHYEVRINNIPVDPKRYILN